MIAWKEYISQLLELSTEFDDITISLDEGLIYSEIPPIIRASISMLDKMLEHQGKLNLLVFPERVQSVFIFAFMKLYHNISQGKIKTKYDPTGFVVGEKLKVGNAIVEYLGTEIRDNSMYLMIKTADVDKDSARIDTLPIFQKVATKRPLSKFKQYCVAKKAALAAIRGEAVGSEKMAYISDMKTHMESSIFTMMPVASVKNQLTKCLINKKKVTTIFHIAQADYEGNITNISPGQMSGIPAIVFASELSAICASIDKGAPAQSIIIDGSNANSLFNQMDALDELIRLDIPIVLVTDIANSFDLEQYAARGFNIWRWNKDNLTDELLNSVSLSSDKRVKNCARQSIIYLHADGKEISSSIQLLAAHRHETENQSPQMTRLFEKLNHLVFYVLRATAEPSELDREIAYNTLEECQNLLNAEKSYLTKNAMDDYSGIIKNLYKIFDCSFEFSKPYILKDFLRGHHGRMIYLIIPERSSKERIQAYWNYWCSHSMTRNNIKVLFPSEYYSRPVSDDGITIICGWMKRAIMRKLIYSYNTGQYVVLLYDYENKWKKYDFSRWNKAMGCSSNEAIIERALSDSGIRISTKGNVQEQCQNDINNSSDELAEIELILKENKYRQYIKNKTNCSKDIVAAIPINFVGGYLSFYTVGHKLISATKIINSLSDQIDSKLPGELSVGDFIVVREADKDIIRELADIALANSGKSKMRELASKWREALQIELLFSSVNVLYQKLKGAGCDKGFATVKRWIEDEDIIAPRSKEDLKIIADVTEYEVLIEKFDSVYEAAQEVRNAHLLAGRKLSEQLKLTLANELKEYENIDPFNFWEPIDIEVDGIGSVKVLKIIDIGTEVEVASSDTNRLIED